MRPDKLLSEMARVLRTRRVAIEEGVAVEDVLIEPHGRAIGVRTSAGVRHPIS